MRTLLLLREAIYNPKLHPLDEAQRPITPRGKMDALHLGEILLERELFPELVLISPTLRSMQTMEAIRSRNRYIGIVQPLDALLNADGGMIMDAISQLSDQVRQVMLVSNMPGLKQVLAVLTGWNKSLPTSTLAYIAVSINKWDEICLPQLEASLVELWHLSRIPDGSYRGFFNAL